MIRVQFLYSAWSMTVMALVVKLVLPALLALLPFHVLVLGRQAAMLHFAFGGATSHRHDVSCNLEYRALGGATFPIYTESMPQTLAGRPHPSALIISVSVRAFLTAFPPPSLLK
jgi:hypothetical protein